jgi:hypothetical protein
MDRPFFYDTNDIGDIKAYRPGSRATGAGCTP